MFYVSYEKMRSLGVVKNACWMNFLGSIEFSPLIMRNNIRATGQTRQIKPREFGAVMYHTSPVRIGRTCKHCASYMMSER